MKKDIEQQSTEKPKAGPQRCKAWGCNCSVCFDGLCEWHDRADNASAWPKITQIMQTADFKYLAWYWQELGKYTHQEIVDILRPDGTILWKDTKDLVALFRTRLHAFGIDPSKTERRYDERINSLIALRKYAYEMRELVMQKVLQDTGAIDHGYPTTPNSMRRNQFMNFGELLTTPEPQQELEDVPF